jgi:hypothetical protein
MKALYFVIAILFGCQNPNTRKMSQNPNIDFKNVAYVTFLNENDTIIITDNSTINNFISNINNSDIEYIKFGSNKKFILYDKNNAIIEEGFYRDRLIKIKGVVYKTKEKIN